MYPTITLKKGKEDNVYFRHPWIFSGALEKLPVDIKHGDLVYVADFSGKIIGTGTYSNKSSIAVRVFEFGKTIIDKAWFKKVFADSSARRKLMGYGETAGVTGFRIIFGEADGVPGLVVDKFGGALVIQISTSGIDRLKPEILAALQEVFKPRSIIERSDLPVRREEGLEDNIGVLLGEDLSEVEFQEYNLKFIADIKEGQKTGFYLDQKDLRQIIQQMAKGRNVLNLFSYTGSLGISAMKGGAVKVHNIDGSARALVGASRQAELNGIKKENFTTEIYGIFDYLEKVKGADWGMVIMDPPAIIKAERDMEEGKKAYHFLNREAMRRCADGGIFVTSSCSHFLTEDDFCWILRRASVQIGMHLNILKVVHQSPDHPVSVYFPNSAYLKTFVCEVRRSEVRS